MFSATENRTHLAQRTPRFHRRRTASALVLLAGLTPAINVAATTPVQVIGTTVAGAAAVAFARYHARLATVSAVVVDEARRLAAPPTRGRHAAQPVRRGLLGRAVTA